MSKPSTQHTLHAWLSEACEGVSAAFAMDATPLPTPQQASFENIAMVGFSGDNLRGSLGVSADWRVMRTFLQQLYPAQADITAAMMLDTLGEIGNQILGRLKNLLDSHGVTVTMTPPMVARGLRITVAGTHHGTFLRQDLDTPCGPVSVWLDALCGDGFALAERSPVEQSAEEGEMFLFS